jgi:hypothetical protein
MRIRLIADFHLSNETAEARKDAEAKSKRRRFKKANARLDALGGG